MTKKKIQFSTYEHLKGYPKWSTEYEGLSVFLSPACNFRTSEVTVIHITDGDTTYCASFSNRTLTRKSFWGYDRYNPNAGVQRPLGGREDARFSELMECIQPVLVAAVEKEPRYRDVLPEEILEKKVKSRSRTSNRVTENISE